MLETMVVPILVLIAFWGGFLTGSISALKAVSRQEEHQGEISRKLDKIIDSSGKTSALHSKAISKQTTY